PISSTISSTTLLLILFLSTQPSTSEIYTLSLHDALPIFAPGCWKCLVLVVLSSSYSYLLNQPDSQSVFLYFLRIMLIAEYYSKRSEEHTSELQSRFDLVCRLLLEKKKKK